MVNTIIGEEEITNTTTEITDPIIEVEIGQ